jgi:hypothetical protein
MGVPVGAGVDADAGAFTAALVAQPFTSLPVMGRYRNSDEGSR